MRGLKIVLLAGAICGVLDITAALVVYGRFGLAPMRLLQGIAAGILGPGAFEGDKATALLGLLCHFSIALGAAGAYFAAARWKGILVAHPIPAGIVYGPVVYFFMNRIVVPLSRAVKYPFSVEMMLIGVAIHVVCGSAYCHRGFPRVAKWDELSGHYPQPGVPTGTVPV